MEQTPACREAAKRDEVFAASGTSGSCTGGAMSSESIFRVEIEAATLDDLRAFVDETQPDPGCRAIPRRRGDAYVMEAFLSETQLTAARDARAASRVTLRVL